MATNVLAVMQLCASRFRDPQRLSRKAIVKSAYADSLDDSRELVAELMAAADAVVNGAEPARDRLEAALAACRGAA